MDCLALEVTNLSLDKRLFRMPCNLRESFGTQINERRAGTYPIVPNQSSTTGRLATAFTIPVSA